MSGEEDYMRGRSWSNYAATTQLHCGRQPSVLLWPWQEVYNNAKTIYGYSGWEGPEKFGLCTLHQVLEDFIWIWPRLSSRELIPLDVNIHLIYYFSAEGKLLQEETGWGNVQCTKWFWWWATGMVSYIFSTKSAYSISQIQGTPLLFILDALCQSLSVKMWG